jgi:hypothetical protein
MLALVIGTLLAVGALAYVLFPLLFGAPSSAARRRSRIALPPHAGEEDAVVALREIEFDRETGKLSDTVLSRARRPVGGRPWRGQRAGGSRRGDGARVPRATQNVRPMWSAPRARRDLLLQLRRLSRRTVRGMRPRRGGDGRRVLLGVRTAARRLTSYRSTASSRRIATRTGMIVATVQSTAAAPNPTIMSVIDVGVP